MYEPYIFIVILFVTFGLFAWGYWRYDIVACIVLTFSLLLGAVPYTAAFDGFKSPAVITVACVMILTQAISRSGTIDFIVSKLTPVTSNPIIHVTFLSVITAVLSAFMNNVGALALMMPVAIQTSAQNKRSPSLVLMPLAFASVLGGLTTAIGTPPNLLISAYRQEAVGQPFHMFDFTPVGIVVCVAAIIFIVMVGWRLLPARKSSKQVGDLFQMTGYITEAKISKNSSLVGKTIREVEKLIVADYLIIGRIRNKRRRWVLQPDELLLSKDILIIEAPHKDLEKLVHDGGLEIVGGDKKSKEILGSDDVGLLEAVLPQGSRVENHSAHSMRFRSRFNLNLLAIAREGKPFKERLKHVVFKAGDVVLLQGNAETLRETAVGLGFLPLAERGVQVGMRPKAFLPLAIFAAAIGLAAFQVLPVQIAFAFGVVVLVLLNIMPTRHIYESVDWSIIVLLGAIIPIGTAMQETGGTDLLAHSFVFLAGHTSPYILLGLLLVVTMTLSDVINNAATAVVMGPIAVSIAQALDANIDPFLMTVAVGASCSFLTPISHQNNTLVMGPGGYKFTDYLRLGFPVELIVLAFGLPMILWIWPMYWL